MKTVRKSRDNYKRIMDNEQDKQRMKTFRESRDNKQRQNDKAKNREEQRKYMLK